MTKVRPQAGPHLGRAFGALAEKAQGRSRRGHCPENAKCDQHDFHGNPPIGCAWII